MKKLTLLATAFVVLSTCVFAQATPPQQPGAEAQAQAQGQSWTGTLVDATCKQRESTGKCPVSGTTTAFGLVLSEGKYYKFDDAGNSTASKEMQNAGTKSGDITATVTGSLEGDTIKVQSIQIQ